MIENDKQRQFTAEQLGKFKEALAQLPQEPTHDLHPLALKAARESLQSEIEVLETQIQEYDTRDTRKAMVKTVSRDRKWYYVDSVVRQGKLINGGWLSVDSDEWLPFAFWEVKTDPFVGTEYATQEEFDRYQKRFDEIAKS